MKILHTIAHPSRVHDVKFGERVNGDGEVLLVASEDKKLYVYTISKDQETPPAVVAEMIGHSNRYIPHPCIVSRLG
jgi:protein MAK11